MAYSRWAQSCAIIGVAFFGLAACGTTHQAEQPVDAILVPTESSEAILLKTISEALGGRNIRLSPTVFTDKSVLIMDPAFVSGRSFATPDHFRLQRYKGECQLRHEQTGKTYPLKGVTCKAVSTDGA